LRLVGHGEVAEWLKAPHSKCGIRVTVSGVRIPPSPPDTIVIAELFAFIRWQPPERPRNGRGPVGGRGSVAQDNDADDARLSKRASSTSLPNDPDPAPVRRPLILDVEPDGAQHWRESG
jgi:hypothetical protein